MAMPDARLGERACAFVGAPVPGFDFAGCSTTWTPVRSPSSIGPSGWKDRTDAAHAVGKIQKYVLRERARSSWASDRRVKVGIDEVAFRSWRPRSRHTCAGPGEECAERIEREQRRPAELWAELRERGYLRSPRRSRYGGRGIPFSRYLELIELFSMSHASLADDRPRRQRHLARDGPFATERAAPRFVLPSVDRRHQGRLHADRADRRAPAPTCAAASCAKATPTT